MGSGRTGSCQQGEHHRENKKSQSDEFHPANILYPGKPVPVCHFSNDQRKRIFLIRTPDNAGLL